MFNAQGFMQLFQQMQNSGNPQQFLKQYGVNLPENMNSNDALQYLLNNKMISQQQVNSAMNLRNNPFFRQFFK